MSSAPIDPARGLRRLAREGLAAVQDARARAAVVRAWELLQARDAHGSAVGTRPYTDEAIQALTEAHQHDPEDLGVVHHLAIAHHARAWDWELAGDAEAADEWEQALGHWQRLDTARPFWDGVQKKLRLLDPEADPAFVDEVKRDLLEWLLAVHVDFIRQYCEQGLLPRAERHIDIVRRAEVRPSVRKRLVGQVFEAMTSALAGARQQGDHGPAMTTVERFLALFPDYLPALRQHAELGAAMLGELSFRDHWDAILDLNRRVREPAARLAAHQELGQSPLASAALTELAGQFGLRAVDRANSAVSAAGQGTLSSRQLADARAAIELGTVWGRLALPHAPTGALARQTLAACLAAQAQMCYVELKARLGSDPDLYTRRAEALDAMAKAIPLLEEAVRVLPGEPGLQQQLDEARSLRQADGGLR